MTAAGPALMADETAERSLHFAAMGGRVSLRVSCPRGAERAAERDLRLVAARIHAWASRLTRFDERSELSRLNRSRTAERVEVGPTLGALLRRSRELEVLTDGLVDITLLDARLAAETGDLEETSAGRWHEVPGGRRHLVWRSGAVAFDLDGVGKGWIADRALALLRRYPAAMVDADGDVALRLGDRPDWAVAIADPRRSDVDLAVVAPPPARASEAVGLGTSGTTVHRWELEQGWAHHLIDPRTGRSAETDVVQATVMADSTLRAEALAKAVVIAGSEAGLGLLERSGAWAGVMLLEDGRLIGTMGSQEWLV